MKNAPIHTPLTAEDLQRMSATDLSDANWEVDLEEDEFAKDALEGLKSMPQPEKTHDWALSIRARTHKLLSKQTRQENVQTSVSQFLTVGIVLVMLLVGAWAVRQSSKEVLHNNSQIHTPFSSAIWALEQGKYAQALEGLATLPPTHRNYGTARLGMVKAYIGLKNWDAATQILSEVQPYLSATQKIEAKGLAQKIAAEKQP